MTVGTGAEFRISSFGNAVRSSRSVIRSQGIQTACTNRRFSVECCPDATVFVHRFLCEFCMIVRKYLHFITDQTVCQALF
jgi:hypothetical protein